MTPPMLSALLLAAIPVVPMHFTPGSWCGLYVGKAPVELTLEVQAGQTVQATPNQDPDQSQPMRVQLAYPYQPFSPPLPAAFESRRVRGSGTYRYRILSSGTATNADVRLCVVE